jgi:hypothetical protein
MDASGYEDNNYKQPGNVIRICSTAGLRSDCSNVQRLGRTPCTGRYPGLAAPGAIRLRLATSGGDADGYDATIPSKTWKEALNEQRRPASSLNLHVCLSGIVSGVPSSAHATSP